MDRHRQDPGYVPQHAASFQSYIVRGPEDSERLPAHLRGLSLGHQEVFIGEEEFEVLVREVGGMRYYVVYEVGSNEQREQSFKMLVWISVLAAALVSLVLGYWLSGMLVAQVTGLARQVGGLRPGEPRVLRSRAGSGSRTAGAGVRRLPGAHRADDPARAGVHGQREPRVAHAAHRDQDQLRAAAGGSRAAGKGARARRAGQRSRRRMAEQIQALLLLARGQAPGKVEPVVLADCVTEAAEPYRAEISRKGLVAVEIGPTPCSTSTTRRCGSC